MTTAEQLLGLAKAMGNDPARIINGHVDVSPRGSWRPTVFDPANNADQFCEVLAWLSNGDAYHAAVDFRNLFVRVWYRTSPGYFDIDHDGTASGLRQAVTDAAVRVCQGVGK